LSGRFWIRWLHPSGSPRKCRIRLRGDCGPGAGRRLAVVGRGGIFGVVGQSGAGKSTLIRTINSVERPDIGTVTVNGRDVTNLTGAGLRNAWYNISMIFQNFNLLSSCTVQVSV
jgi:ABC-type proline/glycine betaine transport system ATPase subunit